MRLLLSVLALFVLIPAVVAQAATTVPSGFEDTKVADVTAPMGIAFTPDGRMLVVDQFGTLSVRGEDGTLISIALDLKDSVCSPSASDRGLQSVAVDPSFATNQFVYIFYTSNKNGTCNDNTYPGGPVNRVSRFVLGDDNKVDPTSEVVLIDDIPSMALHQGGDTAFGKDGYLYVTVGDGECDYAGDSGCQGDNDASRDPNVLLGKVLRLTAPDGGIPPDNPYSGANTARCNHGPIEAGMFCQETYASGLRNPWKFAFDPNASGTRFFINDVGLSTWEEIDLGLSGADYGWNVEEGPCARDSRTDCAPTSMTSPIYSYDHATGCEAITGGAFVPNGAWRPEDDGAYLYGDTICGKIFELIPSAGGGFTSREILSGLAFTSIVDMTFGPYRGGQALYYGSFLSNEIRRLAYIGPPATPQHATPLRVPLVPAYSQCTAPNDTHGAPLDSGSCSPPSQTSPNLTIGTPDANGYATMSSGSVGMNVVEGDPDTPADEANVTIAATISDVRQASDFSDYAGNLRASMVVRDIDRDAGSAGEPSTLTDFPLGFNMPCTPTDDDAIGASCTVATSVDAVLGDPNAVLENSQAIWQLGQVQIHDGGADGDASTTGDNFLFETQGLFVP